MMEPTAASRRRTYRELISFLTWTLGLTYLLFWGPLALFQIPGASAGQQGEVGMGVLPFILGGFIPSIAGIILTVRTEGRTGLRQLGRRAVAFRFSPGNYLALLAIPLTIGAVRLAVQGALGSQIQPAEPLAALIASPAQLIPFAITILFLGPLSEEFGWRGYAQDRLGVRFTPLAGSLFLGGIWALWHLPLFFIPGTSQSAAGQPLLQFALYAVQVISLTVIITWLYNRTGRSLAAVILFHTWVNLVGTVVTYLMQPGLVDVMVQAAGYLAAATVIGWPASQCALTKGESMKNPGPPTVHRT